MIYDYDVKEVQTFDRDKPYWSKHYNLVLADIDLNIKSYQIAIRVCSNTKERGLYLLLYENEQPKAVKATKHSNGKYKFYLSSYLPRKNEDYNINLEYVESRDNPACHIYKVSVN